MVLFRKEKLEDGIVRVGTAERHSYHRYVCENLDRAGTPRRRLGGCAHLGRGVCARTAVLSIALVGDRNPRCTARAQLAMPVYVDAIGVRDDSSSTRRHRAVRVVIDLYSPPGAVSVGLQDCKRWRTTVVTPAGARGVQKALWKRQERVSSGREGGRRDCQGNGLFRVQTFEQWLLGSSNASDLLMAPCL